MPCCATELQAHSAARCSARGRVRRVAKCLHGRGADGRSTAATTTLGRCLGGACATAVGLAAGMAARWWLRWD